LAIIVYAIDDSKSFDDIDLWLKDLRANSNPDIKVFLIGNKIDLEESRLVTREQAEQFKNDFELDLFMETSAKTGFNTQELFVEAAKILYDDYMKYKKKQKKPNEKVKLEKNVIKQEKKGGCFGK
jgi:GTPase SAR1 family protein